MVRPGGISDLAKLISSVGVSVKVTSAFYFYISEPLIKTSSKKYGSMVIPALSLVAGHCSRARLGEDQRLRGGGEDPGRDQEQETQQGALQDAQGKLRGEFSVCLMFK